MAYEKLKLVVAGMSGNIYLSRILKEGVMSDSRRIITEECLAASTEWFMSNKKKMIRYQHDDPDCSPTLFYTSDPKKAEAILAILQDRSSSTEDE